MRASGLLYRGGGRTDTAGGGNGVQLTAHMLERVRWWFSLPDLRPEGAGEAGFWLRAGETRYLLRQEMSPDAVSGRKALLGALERAGIWGLPRPRSGPGGAEWIELEGRMYSLWMSGDPSAQPRRDPQSFAWATRCLYRALDRSWRGGGRMGRYGSWVAGFRRSLAQLRKATEAATGESKEILSGFFDQAVRAIEELEDSPYRTWAERARQRGTRCCGRWRIDALERLWSDPAFFDGLIWDMPLYDAATLAEDLMLANGREAAEFLSSLSEAWKWDGWTESERLEARQILRGYLRFPHRWPWALKNAETLHRYAESWRHGLAVSEEWGEGGQWEGGM